MFKRECSFGHILILGIVLIVTFCGCTGAVLQSSVNRAEPESIAYCLPKGLIHIQLKETTTSGVYELTVEPKIVPDETKLYKLKYLPNSWADDTIDITVGDNGLLKSVATTTVDRTVDIIQKLTEIAKELAKAVTPIKGVRPEEVKFKAVLDVLIDPDEPIDGNITKVLGAAGIQLTIDPPPAKDADGKLTDTQGSPEASPGEPAAASKPPRASIYYRPLKQYKVTFTNTGATAAKFIRTEVIYLPNKKEDPLTLDITRAPFVSKQSTLTFTDGMLTRYQITKPSEVLAGLEIPLKVIKTIIALPTDLIQLKIDYSTKETAWLTQQLNEITARQALENANKTVDAAHAAAWRYENAKINEAICLMNDLIKKMEELESTAKKGKSSAKSKEIQ